MTRISKTIKALVAGAFLLGAVEANAAASTAKPLRVGPVQVHGALNAKSGKIVGAKSGKEVMVRGMSLFWSDATGLQYYNKEVIKWAVENLKMDVVRYAMGVQYYDSQGGTNGKMDENYSYIGNPTLQKNKIDLMVEAAIENDIYIIIDWHSHRADQETSDAKAFFSEMATKYKNVPNIIWEVFNEPVNQSMSAIANYANSVISGIRSAGSQNLAIVGTPSWSQMNECNGVTDNNSAYVFHFYAASHSVGSYSGRISKCKNDGKAVFISEWGTTDANGSGNTNTSAASEWENFMEQNKISNCNWSLRNAESTIGEKTNEASAMFSGSTFLTKQSLLASAGYTTSGNHVKSYLTTHATDWASELVSGNEMGVLLLDYICQGRIEKGTMPKNPVAVMSIVSTPLADKVAEHYGVELRHVLTGFKWIGDQIAQLEAAGETDRFIFGFEESYGYLAGPYVRDKDAVVSSMLICEMAAYYRSIGSSIKQRLEEIYQQYGRYYNKVDAFSFPGLSGMDKMKGIMVSLRQNPPTEFAGKKVVETIDYAEPEKTGLPKANVLIYKLDDGSTVVVRPSGTEPKIKTYFTTLGKDLAEAQAEKEKLAEAVKPLLA